MCDFFTPAIVNRAPLAVAIGTEGAGPVLAQMVRARIDTMLPPSLGPLTALANRLRHRAEMLIPRGAARRAFWRAFFTGPAARAMADGDEVRASSAAEDLLAAPSQRRGHIALVGAGPGAEDLLTLRAHRLLMEADVIVHDALVPDAVIAMGRRDAERIFGRQAQGLPFQVAVRDQRPAGRARPGRAPGGAPEMRRPAGVWPRRRGDAGAARRGHRLRGSTGRHGCLRGRCRFRIASDAARCLVVHGVHHRSRPQGRRAARTGAKLAVAGATVAVYMGRSIAAEVAGA